MPRLATMARFAEPAAAEAKVVAWCACGCQTEIVEGYTHWQMDGEWFYDEGCVLKHLGAERRVAG